jgi:hypothetical protein
MRCYLYLLIAFFLCFTVVAQEPNYRDDLRFAEALRARGDNDLALEFLQALAKTAPQALAKELPFEFAKTRLRVASDEPETGKRLLLYKEARDDFEKFIAANPGHPRIAEANLDIARVLNLQGKTELNRALLSDDDKSKRDLAQQARGTLVEAARQLQAAVKVIEGQVAKLPDPESIEDVKKKKEAQAARARLVQELNQTKLDRALNLYDQANTFIGGSGDKLASELLEEAAKLLASLADGDPAQPIKWKASAWLGRILQQTVSAEKARAKFQEVITASGLPAAAEGVRLARYFRLLVIRENPNETDKKTGVHATILEAASRWRNDYRRFWKTPEGVGLTFLYAEILLLETETNKKLTPIQTGRYRDEARALLREVENSENEFTERARRLKIETIARQGLFKVPIANLRLFEDCYVRAQYEAMQLNLSPATLKALEEQLNKLPDPESIKDARKKKEAQDARTRLEVEIKKLRNPDEAEKRRKAIIDNIIAALERGLSLPEVQKMKPSLELNTARSMLAYWALNTGKLEQAIKAGETFARNDPRSSQAEISAVYALQAYSQLIGQKQSNFEDLAEDRARMFSLASYMEERWPKSIGGDLARHSLGLQLLREENLPEAIKKLSLVGPTYGNYPLVCFQIADACSKAEKASLEPITGDRPGDYGKRKMQALEAMPQSALGTDPFTNQILVAGKAMLGRDLFKLKRFQHMDDLANGLLDRLNKVRFNDDEDKDRATRNQLRFELVDIKLYARYGLADSAFQAGDHPRVLTLLDPLIDAVTKSDESQEKTNMQKNQQLASGLLILALRANIQLGKIDRTNAVLDVLDKVSGEGGDSTMNIVRLLAFLIRGQIDDLRKKGDKDALDKAVKGYKAILGKRIAKQKLTPEFIRVVADCYASMEDHSEAAKLLEKALGQLTTRPGSDEEKLARRIQLDLCREFRLSKDPDNLKKARAIVDGIMGQPKKPGWGMRDLLALKEQGALLEAEGKYADSFKIWANLTKRLAPEVQKGGGIKENYLECYYHMVYCYTKMGMARSAQSERDKFLQTAALQIVQLETNWEEFGSEASKKRFSELLSQESALREAYEAVKKKKK